MIYGIVNKSQQAVYHVPGIYYGTGFKQNREPV
jgi:hypothetical protein